jgi:hypothetical protein
LKDALVKTTEAAATLAKDVLTALNAVKWTEDFYYGCLHDLDEEEK